MKNILYAVIGIGVLAIAIYLWVPNEGQLSVVDNINPVITQEELVFEETSNRVAYNCLEGETALSALQRLDIELETTESSFGTMVDSIGGVNSGDGQYWLYSIDGNDASVGADSYECQGTETIEWELR